MRTKALSVVERAAQLHHLRPFVLDDEPFSFFKARNVVGRSSDSAFLKSRLKDIKQLFNGDHMRAQLVMSRGDMIVNSEVTLKRWLNGFEYHRDESKVRALEESLGPLPVSVSRPIFFMLLMQKAHAILYLGQIIAKMVGMPHGGSVQDAKRPLD